MTRSSCRHAVPLRIRGAVAGFTLIELMIAMVLGLIVIAGIISVFLAGQQSFRSTTALAEVQDSSRIAFELMARDIREAGLTGCDSFVGNVSNVLNNSSSAWWANWNNAVSGYDDAASDPALAAMPAAVANTSSVELISAGVDPVATSKLYDGSQPQFVLNGTAPDLRAGDIAMVCSPGWAAIFQVGANMNGTVTFDSGGRAPGNQTTDLGIGLYPVNTCDGTGPGIARYAPSIYCFPANSMLSRLKAVDWYIGTNPQGGKSLYRVSLQNKAGVPTPTAQEMVPNVTNMTITYLNPTLGNTFQSAGDISRNHAWQGVTALNVALQLESTFQRASVTGNAPIVRQYAFTTTLRNRVD